jgi:hypothetical protein
MSRVNFKGLIACGLLFSMLCLTSCRQGVSSNEKKDSESYGSSENARTATPTQNDESNKDTVLHETGPGSTTVGDSLHRSPNAN